MELCFVKICVAGSRIALYSTLHDALYVVPLMWGSSVWLGHGNINIDSLVKGYCKICGCVCIVGDYFHPTLQQWNY